MRCMMEDRLDSSVVCVREKRRIAMIIGVDGLSAERKALGGIKLV